jgi:hypothetical protein
MKYRPMSNKMGVDSLKLVIIKLILIIIIIIILLNIRASPQNYSHSILAGLLHEDNTLNMEAIRSPETSVLARATRRNIPKDSFLHSHR